MLIRFDTFHHIFEVFSNMSVKNCLNKLISRNSTRTIIVNWLEKIFDLINMHVDPIHFEQLLKMLEIKSPILVFVQIIKNFSKKIVSLNLILTLHVLWFCNRWKSLSKPSWSVRIFERRSLFWISFFMDDRNFRARWLKLFDSIKIFLSIG